MAKAEAKKQTKSIAKIIGKY